MKLFKQLEITSSKLAMENALGDATKGIIKSLTDKTVDGLAKALDTINTKFTVATADVEIQKTDYDKVKNAADEITATIDETLKTGGLTKLDETNLKTLRTAVGNVGKAFESISEMKPEGNDKYKVGKADFDKVKESLGKLGKECEEAGASATKVLESSKAQAENIREKRRRQARRQR